MYCRRGCGSRIEEGGTLTPGPSPRGRGEKAACARAAWRNEIASSRGRAEGVVEVRSLLAMTRCHMRDEMWAIGIETDGEEYNPLPPFAKGELVSASEVDAREARVGCRLWMRKDRTQEENNWLCRDAGVETQWQQYGGEGHTPSRARGKGGSSGSLTNRAMEMALRFVRRARSTPLKRGM